MCTGSPQHSPPVGSTAVEERVNEQVSVRGGKGGVGAMVIRNCQNVKTEMR